MARYWASLTERGDYEIRGVPSTLGEHSRPGGVFPREGFEEHYEKVESWANTEQVLWRPRFLNIRACPLPIPVFAAGSLGHESIGTPCGSSRGMDGKYDPAALQETKRYYGNVDCLSDSL